MFKLVESENKTYKVGFAFGYKNLRHLSEK